jgi:pyruvate/2-oxoglutarate dehydrogenase complex dihydrolipoamide dehydrogenase (E3) component
VSFEYEVVVIGCGPVGETAAKRAARFGKCLAVVEREGATGGILVGLLREAELK